MLKVPLRHATCSGDLSPEQRTSGPIFEIMEVPLAGILAIRQSAAGDLAENQLSGEVQLLHLQPHKWTFGENEDGAFVNASGQHSAESIWLEFEQLVMKGDDGIYFVSADEESGQVSTSYFADVGQRVALKVFELHVSGKKVAISTDEFTIPIEGSKRFWKVACMQDGPFSNSECLNISMF